MKVLDQMRTIGRHSKMRPVTSFQMKRVVYVYWTHYLDAIYPLAQVHQTQAHQTQTHQMHFTDTHFVDGKVSEAIFRPPRTEKRACRCYFPSVRNRGWKSMCSKRYSPSPEMED